ncbi:hypothetical protein SFUMM280S_06883 [Streptomyces fumanus]
MPSVPRRRFSPSADSRARSARTVSSRSAATSVSRSATGPGLAERMSIHIRGSEAAIRVTSRMPCPHSRTALSSACSRRAATRLETRWGMWETRATARSWASASITTGTAAQCETSSRARFSTSVSVSPVGVSTQGRPSNRSAVAASGPDFSRPDIGWVPRYDVRSRPRAWSWRRGPPLTLATSR